MNYHTWSFSDLRASILVRAAFMVFSSLLYFSSACCSEVFWESIVR